MGKLINDKAENNVYHNMYFSGQNNVAGVDLCLREKNCVVFVMPYQPHEAFNVSIVQCKTI